MFYDAGGNELAENDVWSNAPILQHIEEFMKLHGKKPDILASITKLEDDITPLKDSRRILAATPQGPGTPSGGRRVRPGFFCL